LDWSAQLPIVCLILESSAALQDGYDHSYFFISSFVDEHVAHAAQALKSS